MECDFCDHISECETNNCIGTCWRFKDFKGAIEDLNSQMSSIIEKTNNLINELKPDHDLLYAEFNNLETLARYANDAVKNDKWWHKGE
jgi:hypothetical protein